MPELSRQVSPKLNISNKMLLRLKVSYFLTAIFITGVSLGITVAGEALPFLAEVNTNNINVRADATVNSKVICTLNKRDRVDVVSESSEWYKIRLPEKTSVYIKADFADCIKYQDVNPIDRNTCLKVKILNSRVNVRISPNESGEIVGIVEKDEIVEAKGKVEGWYRIEPTKNCFAWAHKKFFNKLTDKEVRIKKNEVQEEVAPQSKDIILKGVVKPYGIVFRRVATHKLITADKKIYLLKGDKATLNALNYNRVKVSGKIVGPLNAKYPLVEVAMIELSD